MFIFYVIMPWEWKKILQLNIYTLKRFAIVVHSLFLSFVIITSSSETTIMAGYISVLPLTRGLWENQIWSLLLLVISNVFTCAKKNRCSLDAFSEIDMVSWRAHKCQRKDHVLVIRSCNSVINFFDFLVECAYAR